MKKHKRTNTLSLLAALPLILAGQTINAQEQELDKVSADTVVNVGYATGSIKKLSGSVELIKEDQMNKIQIVNPIEAIQGRVAGLTINKGGNGTAALDAVRLRGSFTILKDASETAQYGSRGASGVINVVTKKGIKGKTSINYSGSFGISSVYKRIGMLDADEYRNVTSSLGLSIIDKGYNTNFQKIRQNHNIALYGGGEKSTYRVSLGYLDMEGDIMNEGMKMFTSNMNLNQKLIDNLVDCELGIFGSVKRERSLFDLQKTFYSAATFNPTFPGEKNSSGAWDNLTTASQITNPLAWMEVDNREAASYFSAHAKINVNLPYRLKLVLFGSYTYNNTEDSQYLPTTVWAYGQGYRGLRSSESLLGNMMLTYNRQMGKHFIDVLALGELSKDRYSGFYTTATNFSSDYMGFNNLQAGALRPWDGTGSYFEDPRQVSFLGRVNYSYDDRYVVTLNARTDASSKFGVNHKWGFFPSASVAWNISQEDFMRYVDIVDNLKVRLGYGLAGNQGGISSYTTMNLAKPNGVAPVGNLPMVTFETLRNVNPDLKLSIRI